MEENENWKEEYRKRAEERVKAVEAAQARIDALIARAGSPVMIVKSGEQNRFSNHMKEIDEIACAKAKELKILKSNAIIMVLCDEIEMMDDQITGMANIIDRMEAALHNVINERDQLIFDLKKIVDELSICNFCLHDTEDGDEEECLDCADGPGKWEWRGVPDKEE